MRTDHLIIPAELSCRTTGQAFTPVALDHEPLAPELVGAFCPWCDERQRTGADAAHDYRAPQVHSYVLRPNTPLARLGQTADAYGQLQALLAAIPGLRERVRR